MNVSLTPELEQLINAKVQSGMYHSASEVIREGLRLLVEQDELKRARVEALNREIDKGIASLKEQGGIPGEQVYRELLERRKSYQKQ